MLALIRTLVRAASIEAEAKTSASRTLTLQETEIVSGGFNPQPDPPGAGLRA